jgi:hypothetical protein
MPRYSLYLLPWLCCLLLLILPRTAVRGQGNDTLSSTQFTPTVTRFWLNTYGNIRLTDRFFWVAQTHFRFQQSPEVPFVGQVAQVYNRHAISYLHSKTFNASLGGVLRVNFNPNEATGQTRTVVPEWRIWHEYQFAVPLSRMMIYHRLRIEHRWTRAFEENSSYLFRNRWRYMFNAKIPLNKPKLQPQAFYLSPEAELIMQSGRPVIGSPMEDLRLHLSFGYILRPQLTLATGLMYSMGQDLSSPEVFNQRLTIRFHIYFSPDLRPLENRLPAVH